MSVHVLITIQGLYVQNVLTQKTEVTMTANTADETSGELTVFQ